MSRAGHAYHYDRGARISEGMRVAAIARQVEDQAQEFAELDSPAFEDAHPRQDAISTVWLGKHCDAIRFHQQRGMSFASLARIYGRDTVLAVLGVCA